MATFVESHLGEPTDQPRRGLLGSRRGPGRPASEPSRARVLAGALPVSHRIVVVDIGVAGDSARWSADAVIGVAAALGRYRPGGVVAWDLAGPADPASSARRIADDADDLLAPETNPRALVRYVRAMPEGHDLLTAHSALSDEGDLEDVLAVLARHRQTMVVHVRASDAFLPRLLDGADVIVLPIPQTEAASALVVGLVERLGAEGHQEWADRIVVVKCDGRHSTSTFGPTDVRRMLGEAGVRTILDGPAEHDGDPSRAWSHVAEIITRTRSSAAADPHPPLLGRDRAGARTDTVRADTTGEFEVTTATLRARASESPVRRRGRRRLPAAVAVGALLLAGALGTTVFLTQTPSDAPAIESVGAVLPAGGAEPTGSTAPATVAPAVVDPARVSGPAVIARYDDLYYRDRDAVAAASLWDLSESEQAAEMIVDLQRSIDAVDPAIRHRIDIRPTSAPTVFDAVLTLTVPDGREFAYDQQFTVREDEDGYAIVRKIDCTGPCPAP